MDSLTGFSPTAAAPPLLALGVLALAALVFLALRAPHLARIGLRNVPRRPARTLLVVFGLMLATTFIAAALAVDDTVTLAVKTVAVFNLGRIDEQVSGRDGPLGLFSEAIGPRVASGLADDPHVAGVASALSVPNLLVADLTARQSRGAVTGLGMESSHAGPLGDLRAPNGAAAPVGALGPSEVYLDRTLAQLMNARAGDQIELYSTLWPGQRYPFTVRAVVSGGPLGDVPILVMPLATMQRLVDAPLQINRVYVANVGDGLSGVGYSDEILDRLFSLGLRLRIADVKQDGVTFSLRAEDIFGRILLLFTLFALAIGLLLIFLIFVLLAAERRAELGMARAVGLRRGHIVRMLLFEGASYDAFAAVLGVLAGLGLGVVIVSLVGPTIAQLGFPLRIDLEPHSLIVALGLGFLFTLVTIVAAAWTVSHMTVAAALRDLPEPPAPQPSLLQLLAGVLLPPRGTALAAWLALAWGIVARGLVPLALGAELLRRGIAQSDILLFSLGLSSGLTGLVLVLRWLALAGLGLALRGRPRGVALVALARATRAADRLSAAVIGGGLALYWSLPYDALAGLGLPRFSGGIPVFFVAGVMMVFGVVLALAPNLDLLLGPIRWLTTRAGRLRHVTRIALIYPGRQRFRTGIGLALFSMVCFTMVVMATIAASTTHSFDNVQALSAGYDIAGQPLFTPVGGVDQVRAAIQTADPTTAGNLSAVSAASPLPLALIQPEVASAAWSFWPASQVSGGFLDGVGLPLVARASGYGSDAAVWHAVRDQPGNVVIDIGALAPLDAAYLRVQQPPPPRGIDQFLSPPLAAGLTAIGNVGAAGQPGGTLLPLGDQGGALGPIAGLATSSLDVDDFTLQLQGVVGPGGHMRPVTLWAADLRGGQAIPLHVIGLVDNEAGQRFGLFGSAATFAPTESGFQPFSNTYYYFAVRPGVDAHAASRAIGSALLDHGFETTVLADVLLNINGPRVYISRVLVGLVGLTLLVGMAALAVTGSRAVVERRQQIGMLRALGFRRLHVQVIFLLESLLVGTIGAALGAVLGLVLCRNVFAVDFFEQFQSGLVLVVPWSEIAIICAAALAAALLAALLPAWQAGRVAPVDALRYE